MKGAFEIRVGLLERRRGLFKRCVTAVYNVGTLVGANPGIRDSYRSKSDFILMNEDWLASSSAARILHFYECTALTSGTVLERFHPPEMVVEKYTNNSGLFYLILINNS